MPRRPIHHTQTDDQPMLPLSLPTPDPTTDDALRAAYLRSALSRHMTVQQALQCPAARIVLRVQAEQLIQRTETP